MDVYTCTANVSVPIQEIWVDGFLKQIDLIDKRRQRVLTIKNHSDWCNLTKDANLGLNLEQLNGIYKQMRSWGWLTVTT